LGQLAITVNGRSYPIACEEGQEKHLAELGAYVDKRVKDLVASVGQVGDTRLLVMASLLIADELSELYDEMDTLRADMAAQEGSPVPATGSRGNGKDTALAQKLDAAARVIEDIAAQLERV
jgi:cell division protein ZapA